MQKYRVKMMGRVVEVCPQAFHFFCHNENVHESKDSHIRSLEEEIQVWAKRKKRDDEFKETHPIKSLSESQKKAVIKLLECQKLFTQAFLISKLARSYPLAARAAHDLDSGLITTDL